MATIDLDAIRVASPCPVDWNSMQGDDQVRFCGKCQLNVYNLGAMSADEARGLIEKSEGRICVRFYRRHDGKVLTRDCPSGVRTVRRRRAGVAAGLAAAAGFAGGLMQGLRGRTLPVAEPVDVVQAPEVEVPTGREPMMGAVVYVPPTEVPADEAPADEAPADEIPTDESLDRADELPVPPPELMQGGLCAPDELRRGLEPVPPQDPVAPEAPRGR